MPRATPGKNSGFLRSLPLALAAIAVALQCLLIQPHVDGFAHFTAREAPAFSTLPSNPPGDASLVAKCPICQQAAAGRTYVLPPAAAIGLTTSLVAIAAPTWRVIALSPTPSHAWQSRAPPHHA